jgi:Metallo-peptidase family M12B Reprolysin-like
VNIPTAIRTSQLYSRIRLIIKRNRFSVALHPVINHYYLPKSNYYNRIRIVQTLFLDASTSSSKHDSFSTWDPIANGQGLQELKNRIEIQQYRDETGADLVAVLAGAGGYCGITNRVDDYRSIINIACLSQYSFAHEIGHCLGTKHNRDAMQGHTKNHPYSYAYRDPQNRYRTIGSYDCAKKTCPRVPFFSSSTMTLSNGHILGDPNNDNLRTIYDNANNVAQYRSTQTSSSSGELERNMN